MITQAQIRRMAGTLSMMLNATNEGERQSAATTMKNQLSRAGVDTSKQEELITLLTVGFHGEEGKNTKIHPDSAEFRKRTRTVTQLKEFSKETLSKHEGISQPMLIRLLVSNAATHRQHISTLEQAFVNSMLSRRPLKILDDEWDQVHEILRKVGLSQYAPEPEDIHEEN